MKYGKLENNLSKDNDLKSIDLKDNRNDLKLSNDFED